MKLQLALIRPACWAVFFLVSGTGAFAKAAPQLTFEKAFDTQRQPAATYFEAQYQSGGKTHTLKVWRDRNLRLRRETDGHITTFVVNKADDDWTMTVLDSQKKIETVVDRTNLYRVGNFTSWFGLAHGLNPPVGKYEVRAMTKPPTNKLDKTAPPCNWYSYTRNGNDTQVCWSNKLALPTAILNDKGDVIWKITQVSTKPFDLAKTFRFKDEGYIRNDANADISGD